MLNFFHTPREKNEKKLRIVFGGFFLCGITNIHNNKLVHDA